VLAGWNQFQFWLREGETERAVAAPALPASAPRTRPRRCAGAELTDGGVGKRPREVLGKLRQKPVFGLVPVLPKKGSGAGRRRWAPGTGERSQHVVFPSAVLRVVPARRAFAGDAWDVGCLPPLLVPDGDAVALSAAGGFLGFLGVQRNERFSEGWGRVGLRDAAKRDAEDGVCLATAAAMPRRPSPSETGNTRLLSRLAGTLRTEPVEERTSWHRGVSNGFGWLKCSNFLLSRLCIHTEKAWLLPPPTSCPRYACALGIARDSAACGVFHGEAAAGGAFVFAPFGKHTKNALVSPPFPSQPSPARCGEFTAVEATAGAAWVTWGNRGFSPAAGNAWKPGAALGLPGSSGSLACLYRGQQAGWQAGWERPESR